MGFLTMIVWGNTSKDLSELVWVVIHQISPVGPAACYGGMGVAVARVWYGCDQHQVKEDLYMQHCITSRSPAPAVSRSRGQ